MCRSCGVVAAAAPPALFPAGSLSLADAIPFAVGQDGGSLGDDTDLLRQWGVAPLPLNGASGAAFGGAADTVHSGAYNLLSALLLSSGYGNSNKEAHIESSCFSSAAFDGCCLQSREQQVSAIAAPPAAVCAAETAEATLQSTAAAAAAAQQLTTGPHAEVLVPAAASPVAPEAVVATAPSTTSSTATTRTSSTTTTKAGQQSSYTKQLYILDFSSVLQGHWLNATAAAVDEAPTQRTKAVSQSGRSAATLYSSRRQVMSDTRYIPINHYGSILQHITPFDEIGARGGGKQESQQPPRQQQQDVVGVVKTPAAATADALESAVDAVTTPGANSSCSSKEAKFPPAAAASRAPAAPAAAAAAAQPLARVARVSMLEGLNQMSRHEILEAIFAHNAFANVRECRRLIHAYLAANETRLPTSELRKLFYIISAVPKDTLFGWVSGIGDLPTKRLAPVTCFEEEPLQSLTAAEVAVRDISSRAENCLEQQQSSPAMQRLWQTHFPLGNQLLKFISFSHPKLLTTCSYDEAWQVLAALNRARGVRYSRCGCGSRRENSSIPVRASRLVEALI